MTTAVIRQKLQSYIDTIEDKKVKALYTMFEDDIEDNYDHWKDKAFLDELDRRSENLKLGKSKTHNWEDIKAKLLAKSNFND